MNTKKPLVICTTLLIENSPQALPLGAACIASAIKNDARTKDKFSVELRTLSMEESGYPEKQPEEFIAAKITGNDAPDYVCFSVYVWNRNELEETAALLKKRFPSLITIAGGPEVTASPQSFKNFDWCVAGEGECAVPDLLFFLEKQKAGRTEEMTPVQGVFCANENSSGKEKNDFDPRALPPELEKLASPYLDGTLDPSAYEGALWELARGCPFKCSYCYESKGEKTVRYIPMERIEKELELFNKKKLRQIFVLDPTYNADKKRALQLLRLIRQKAPGMFFYFEARAEFIDRELARAFTQIPCAIQIGLQSADPEILRYVHRSLDKKKFVKNINLLNEEGAVFGFDLIYGLPKDTLEGFKKSLDFALGLYPNNVETFCLSVLPGTILYETALSLGSVFSRVPPYNVIKTDAFSEKDLQKAKELSTACTIFYNDGRAVPWFNAVCRYFHMRPSQFLADFYRWYKERAMENGAECRAHTAIEKMQIDFICEKLSVRKDSAISKPVIKSLILFNGALSRVESDGTEQTAELSFHPDDLISPYAADILFFAQNAKRFPCKVRCFKSKTGQIDWKIIHR